MLRQDNADQRLTPVGREIGLVDDLRWSRFCARREAGQTELARLRSTVLPPSPEVNALLERAGTTPLSSGVRLAELLKRPQLHYEDLAALDAGRPRWNRWCGNRWRWS